MDPRQFHFPPTQPPPIVPAEHHVIVGPEPLDDSFSGNRRWRNHIHSYVQGHSGAHPIQEERDIDVLVATVMEVLGKIGVTFLIHSKEQQAFIETKDLKLIYQWVCRHIMESPSISIKKKRKKKRKERQPGSISDEHQQPNKKQQARHANTNPPLRPVVARHERQAPIAAAAARRDHQPALHAPVPAGVARASRPKQSSGQVTGQSTATALASIFPAGGANINQLLTTSSTLPLPTSFTGSILPASYAQAYGRHFKTMDMAALDLKGTADMVGWQFIPMKLSGDLKDLPLLNEWKIVVTPMNAAGESFKLDPSNVQLC